MILDHLRRYRCASVSELSQTLHVTKADVRYHLKELMIQGEIEKDASIRPEPKGRPASLFRIAAAARPENYRMITEALLSFQQAETGTASTAGKLAAYLVDRIPPAKQFTVRLNRLVNFFCDHAYDARWEAREEGPRILFRNCPYAAILTGHAELCQMDLELIQNYLGQGFQQIGQKNAGARSTACIFQSVK